MPAIVCVREKVQMDFQNGFGFEFLCNEKSRTDSDLDSDFGFGLNSCVKKKVQMDFQNGFGFEFL